MKTYRINQLTRIMANEEGSFLIEQRDTKLSPGSESESVLLNKRDLLSLYYAIHEIITGEHIDLPN